MMVREVGVVVTEESCSGGAMGAAVRGGGRGSGRRRGGGRWAHRRERG